MTRMDDVRMGERSGENDAWIEAIAQGVETVKDETGKPFVVRFPWPLTEAQEKLVRALGATPVFEQDADRLEEFAA